MSQGWAPLPSPQAPLPPLQWQPPTRSPSKPSGLYKALGIVQIVLGTLGVLYALFGAASLAFFAHYARGAPTFGPETLAFSIAQGAASVLTGALLGVTGVGVVRAKRWSRPLGVAYAALSLLVTYASAAVNVFVLQPRMYARMHLSPPAPFHTFSMFASALSVLVMSALPIATLVMLLRAQARDELDQ